MRLASGETRLPLLRRTLPGEYISFAMIVHATFGCCLWAIWSVDALSGLLMVIASAWIVVRAADLFAERSVAVFVTAALAVTTLSFQQFVKMPASHLWCFSPAVFVGMLAILLCADIAEFFASPPGMRMRVEMRRWNWHRIAVWVIGITCLMYVVAVPTVTAVLEAMEPKPPEPSLEEELSLSNKILVRSMEAITSLVFFTLGATIGSFLNVVVFRMPRGESVVLRPSRCPQCEMKIKGRDNVPILGWLMLNGRCRNCQTSISSRYPTVEAICGTIFLLLFFFELISGGGNLPLRRANFHRGVVWIIFYTKWDLLSVYLFHCFSLSTLLTWALIDHDRQRAPWWARFGVYVILLAAAVMMPDLYLVPWLQETTLGIEMNEQVSALLTGIVGGLCGAVLGGIVSFAIRSPKQASEFHDDQLVGEEAQVVETQNVEAPLLQSVEEKSVELTSDQRPPVSLLSSGLCVSASTIVGMTVGWQAVFGVWIITLVLRPVVLRIARQLGVRQPPVTAILLVAHLAHLLGWNLLSTGWWPSYLASPITWAGYGVAFGVLCVFNRIETADACEPTERFSGHGHFARNASL